MSPGEKMLGIVSLCAILCFLFAPHLVADRISRVFLDDIRARVVQIDLTDSARYETIAASSYGAVWISLGPGVFVEEFDGRSRIADSGEAHFIKAGEIVRFKGRQPSGGRLILVTPKQVHQRLTVLSETLEPGDEEDDASSRNETLVVAVTRVELRDTWNLARLPL